MTTKKEYYIEALKNNCFQNTDWVMSCFSVFKEEDTEWTRNPYPYRLVIKDNAYHYIKPESTEPGAAFNLVKIDGAKATDPLMNSMDMDEFTEKDIPNLKGSIKTTYGVVLLNFILLIFPFGTKISFVQGPFEIRDITKKIASLLTDDPKEGDPVKDNVIYVREYLLFADAAFYLTNFAEVFVPPASKKAITVSPEVIKLRDELFKKFADQLTDPSVLAKVEAELIAADKASLKGDSSEGFLNTSGKSYNIIRKKLFLLLGSEEGVEESAKVDPVLKSLDEGWDIEKFDTINTISRAGSFKRGAQTALAGELVKWLFRASSSVSVEPGDCGSKVGIPTLIEDTSPKFQGRYILTNTGTVELTEESIKSYVGKTVLVRSPQFCIKKDTVFCECCVGKRLSLHPDGVPAALANVGSQFLAIFLAAMHGKALQVKRIDFSKALR